MSRQRICILGATGSIGASTLAVIRQNPQLFEVAAVTAHANVEAMLAIYHEFKPQTLVMVDADAAASLRAQIDAREVTILSGAGALIEVAAAPSINTVMAAIVGGAGLLPTLAAVEAGKRVLLANKEALVMSGLLFIDAARRSGAQLLPVDSEHNAIFQCLPTIVQEQLGYCDLAAAGVHEIILTGSGGPFRETPLAELEQQSPAAACAHPNWDMGRKISVDSATMMNKGLEYIEARWLFNTAPEQLKVVLHPQSVIHSMVSYQDGSVLAQMGRPDMCTPIAHCLSYPERINSSVKPLNFLEVGSLTFANADAQRYPCLQLAMECCWLGQWATTSLNAANEIAVAAFLEERIGFTDIARVCATTVEAMATVVGKRELNSIPALLSVDKQAREHAADFIEYSLVQG